MPPLIEYSAQGIYVIVSSQEGEVQLQPDSRPWFDWLATLSSFRFVGPVGRFTARRGYRQGQQTRYWSAFRCIHRHASKHYLGVTESLTIASMLLSNFKLRETRARFWRSSLSMTSSDS